MARFSDPDSVTAAIADVLRPASKNGWVMVTYNGNNLVLEGKGTGGVNEVRSRLRNDAVQYILLRIEDRKEGAFTTRDVFVAWTGPEVSKIQAAKRAADAAVVQSVMRPSHAQITAVNKERFTESEVRDKSAPLSGSHHIE
jgi:hypothetical protein